VTLEEKFKIIEDYLGRPMGDEEKETAKQMLEERPADNFAGSYSPAYVARRLDMLYKTKKPEVTEDNNGEQRS
jgi:hypothetical protein